LPFLSLFKMQKEDSYFRDVVLYQIAVCLDFLLNPIKDQEKTIKLETSERALVENTLKMTFTLFSKELRPKVFKMIKREAVWSQSKHQNTLKDGFTKKLDE
jgi:hypothetical protein